MCNILIYFCNNDIKHLQHTSVTLETYICNMRFQCEHLLAASANGGSSTRGGHRCAHQQRGARRRRTEGEVGASQAAVAQRTAGQRVELTCVLAGSVELADNVELGGSAQRAGRRRHGRRRRRGRVGAAAVAQRVGGASEQSDALTLAFL